ncbi:MAG: hypothetical protein HXL48_08730 [Solobacterium sp.]|nr:hypothetical protein [Solobacterium sp.]DAQ73763.1 MAG TPA: hypothetical protein [Caudoviricetes sp.]
MYSIQTQNKDTIYYNPNIKKLYIIDKTIDNKLQYEVRATIDNDDRLLGRYSDKSVAHEIMNDLISDSFWGETAMYIMPEDK